MTCSASGLVAASRKAWKPTTSRSSVGDLRYGGFDVGDQVGFDNLEYRLEQIFLAVEVVVQGATGDSGTGDDVFDRDVTIVAPRE